MAIGCRSLRWEARLVRRGTSDAQVQACRPETVGRQARQSHERLDTGLTVVDCVIGAERLGAQYAHDGTPLAHLILCPAARAQNESGWTQLHPGAEYPIYPIGSDDRRIP